MCIDSSVEWGGGGGCFRNTCIETWLVQQLCLEWLSLCCALVSPGIPVTCGCVGVITFSVPLLSLVRVRVILR